METMQTAIDTNGRTLALRCKYKSRWYGLYYKSSCTATVTDQSGAQVKVDKLTANLVHSGDYGTHRQTRRGASRVRVTFSRVGIPNSNQSAKQSFACATHAGYGRWCTNQ